MTGQKVTIKKSNRPMGTDTEKTAESDPGPCSAQLGNTRHDTPEYPRHSPAEKKWIFLRGIPLTEETPAQVLIACEGILEPNPAGDHCQFDTDHIESIDKEHAVDLKKINDALVTEIKLGRESQRVLATRVRKLMDAIETIEDGFAVYDADDQLVLFNQKYKETYQNSSAMIKPGVAFEEIIRAGANNGEYPDALGRVDEWVNERLMQHRHASGTIEQRLSDGRWLKIAERRLETGDTIGFRVDITQYKKTEEALRKSQENLEIRIQEEVDKRLALEKERSQMALQLNQAQKMESIGTLAGGIAHDFNNILFPIIGHVEMLKEDIPQDSPLQDSLNEIHKSSIRARELVHQILAFSRQEKTELRPLKIQTIIKETLRLIRSTIPATITMRQDICPDCGWVEADPVQIHQIVMNLSTNAYHAMEETGGELSVDFREVPLPQNGLKGPGMIPGKYACLSVKDTGYGIDKPIMDRIFEPFFTTKNQGKGTGMGLYVVQGIVKNLGGAIQVQSQPGKGTEFTIFLPIAEQTKRERPDTGSEYIPEGTERILLVDDEAPILKIEKQMLERLGYRVTTQLDGLEALTAFQNAPDDYDLIITDMNMPNLSGDKLSIEAIQVRPDIPILICTGYSEILTDELLQSLGIRGILMKPVVVKELAAKIRELLDK